ncbi:hypothetical protein J6590_048191 [Homalodisca vitripennis]|nr:hypothetical protein J6590_048191 [Homalodisca vitripennis]
MFLSGLDPSVSSEDIVTYLKSLKESETFVCEKLETRYNTYSSFKIGVSYALGEELMHPNLWFEGCIIGKYRAPRNRPKPFQQSVTSGHLSEPSSDPSAIQYVDFTVVHWNVQGVLHKIDEISLLSNKFGCHVVCICEHWEHRDNLAELVIPGFVLASAYHRPSAKRGGTAVFLKSDLKFKELSFLVNLSVPSVCEVAAVVEILVEAGANVDYCDADQRTALRAAAWGGHDEIVTLLLRAGSDVNKTDCEGRTALIAAAYMGHSDIVETLLEYKADINHQDNDGRTALSVAALCVPISEGYTKVVNILLERGADVDHEDKEGMTPLLVAAFEGHSDICELLLEAEADVDHCDSAGRSPLWVAASMGHADVVSLLLFWGCTVDTIDIEGRTVLSVASAQGNTSVVNQLLHRAISLNSLQKGNVSDSEIPVLNRRIGQCPVIRLDDNLMSDLLSPRVAFCLIDLGSMTVFAYLWPTRPS